MKERDLVELSDALETARIFAGAKMEELCNENKYIQAYVFQAIRDSLAQNIELLQSYNTLYCKLKEKNNNIEALEQEPCEKYIKEIDHLRRYISKLETQVVEQEQKTGRCKKCKWWRDSDGVYRRGIHAESKCPINHREVMEGRGYCFMYEPQESEEKK